MKRNNLIQTLFKSNESKFELRTALKVSLVPFLGLVVLLLQFRVFLHSIFSYFKANRPDLVSLTTDTCTDAVFTGMSDDFLFFLLYFVGVFFIGLGLSLILLHPIEKIKTYCHDHLMGTSQKDFSVSGLEHGRLLDRVSYSFFHFVKGDAENFNANAMDEYQAIDRPPFEWTSYIQYYSFVLIIVSVSGVLLNIFMTDTYSEVISVANSYLDASDKTLNSFLNSQRENLDFIFLSTIISTCLFYIILGQNLIHNISGVSFAFFRTMRDVMAGNRNLRVHLRVKDPGHEAASELNELLEESF